MRSLIHLIIVAVIAIIGYNYFYGTVEEKAQSKEIVDSVADSSKKIFKSVGGLLKSEKEKFDNGKYDEAMGDLKNVFANLKQKASTEGSAIKEELAELDLQREKLAEDIKENAPKQDDNKTKKLKEDFDKLTEAAKVLMEKLGEK